MSEKRTVVTLCGSTRFYEAFQQANYRETMAGRIVLSVGFYPHSAGQAHGEAVGIPPEEFDAVKERLDALHLDKVAMSDEILVLDVPRGKCLHCGGWHDNPDSGVCSRLVSGSPCGGTVLPVPYVGESTRREIQHAERLSKRVRYLSMESGQS